MNATKLMLTKRLIISTYIRPRILVAFYTTIVIFLFCVPTKAQKTFQKGTVVNNAGDSIHGFINIKDWQKNPESFLFKKELNDPSDKVYTINDVRYFEVSDFRYLRHLATITMDPVKATTATVSEVQPRTDTVFLRVFQRGKNVSLFAYTDELKTRYYIMESGTDTPVELELRMKAWRDNYSVWHTGLFEGYKNQLSKLATKYGTMSTKMQWNINHTQYGEDILKIASAINGLDGKATRVRAKPGIHFYGGVSTNTSWLTYAHGGNSHYPMADNAKSSSYTAPGFTAGIDFARMRDVSKLHLIFEVMITEMKNHTTSYQQYVTSRQDVDYKFAFRSYNLSLLLHYNLYQTKRTNIFIGTGLRFTAASYSQNICSVSGTVPTLYKDQFQLPKTWGLIPAKAGILVGKRIQIYGTYFTTLLFNKDMTMMKEFLHTYQVGVNYVIY